MADITTQTLTRVPVTLPGADKVTTVEMTEGMLVAYQFDTSDATFASQGKNLVLTTADGGTIVFEGFLDLAQAGELPVFELLGGEQVPGDVYLFAFDLAEETASETAGNNALSGSGVGMYVDDDGNLYRSLDSLQAMGDPDGDGGVDLTADDIRAFLATPSSTPPTITGQLSFEVNEDGFNAATGEDTPLVILDTDILALVNDPDPNSVVAVTGLEVSGGTLVKLGAGVWSFMPEQDFFGEVEITFTVSDGTFTVGGGGTIEVLPVNDAPVAGDEDAAVIEDASISGTVADNVTDVDTDAEDLSYTLDGDQDIPDGLTFNPDGSWSFDASSYDSLADGATETYDVNYTVSDGELTDTGTLTITVTGTNDAPTASAAVIAASEDTAEFSGRLAASDVDEGDTLTYALVGEAPDGFTLNGDGTWTFNPADADYDGLIAGQDQTYNLEYTVTDGNGGSTTQSLTISVTGADDPADITIGVNDSAEGSVTEDATADTLTETGHLTISDADDGQSFFDTERVDSAEGNLGSLTIDADGTWHYSIDNTLPEVQELGTDGSFTETFTVWSEDGSTSQEIEVTVNGVNDAPELTFTAADTSHNFILGGSFEGVDIDAGDWASGYAPAEWTKEGGDRWEVMSGTRYGIPGASDGENVIDTGVGNGEALSISQRVNGLTEGEYVITFDTLDRGMNVENEDSGVIDVFWNGEFVGFINPGSDAWETGTFTINVGEDETTGTLTLTSYDADGFGNVIDNVAMYAVDSVGGDAPVTVDEDVSAGSLVATAIGSDVDSTDLTFSIVDNDSPFAIDQDGNITLADGQSLDHETTDSYTITVAVSDGEITTTKDLTINVGDVNEAPIAADLTLDSIAEDSGAQILTQAQLLAGAYDLDDGDTETLQVTDVTLAEGEGTLVDNEDGTWTFTPDDNWSGDVEFSYSVTDGELSTTRTASLEVTPVNDGPTIEFATAIGEQNLIQSGSFEGIDIDAGDWASGYAPKDWTLVEGDRWEVMSGTRYGIPEASDGDNVIDTGVGNGEALVISQKVTGLTGGGQYVITFDTLDRGMNVENEDSGSVDVYWNDTLVATINPGSDAWETGTITIDLGADETSGTLTLASSDADGFGNVIDNVAMRQVTPLTGDAVIAEDAVPGDYVATAIGADIDSTGLTFSIVGDSPFTIDQNGLITLAPGETLDHETTDSYTITVAVSDGDVTTTSPLTINVGDVNEIPVNTEVTLDAIDEDASVLITKAQLLAGTDDPEDGDLDISGLTVDPEQGSLDDNGDGTWTFTPVENFNGEVTFTYSVEDGDFSVPQTASMTVNDINDAPTVDGNVSLDDINEDGTVTITQAQLLQGADDVDGDDLSVTGVTLAAGTGSLADNGDGTWTFTPEGDWNGAVELSYSVTDGTVSTPQTANFKVLAVNDAPTVDGNVSLDDINEDGTVTITQAQLLQGAGDVDGDDLSVTGVTLAAGTGSLDDNGDGTWTFTPEGNWNGEVELSYSVTDGTVSTPQTANFEVLDINDAPTGRDFTAQAGDVDDAVVLDIASNVSDVDGTVTDILITDLPEGGTLYYTDENGVKTVVTEADLTAVDEIGAVSGDLGTQFAASGAFSFEADTSGPAWTLLGTKTVGEQSIDNWGEEVNAQTREMHVGDNTITVSTTRNSLNQYEQDDPSHIGIGLGDDRGNGINADDEITIDFGDAVVSTAKVGFDGLGGHFEEGSSQRATATWTALLDGEVVGSGNVTNSADNDTLFEELTITSDMLDGGFFDSIVFSTDSNAGSNWELRYVEAEYGVDTSVSFLPVDDDGAVGNLATVDIDVIGDVLTHEPPVSEGFNAPLVDGEAAIDFDPYVSDLEDDAGGMNTNITIKSLPEHGHLVDGEGHTISETGGEYDLTELTYVADDASANSSISGAFLGTRVAGDQSLDNWGVEKDAQTRVLDLGDGVKVTVSTDQGVLTQYEQNDPSHIGVGIGDSDGNGINAGETITVDFDGAAVSYAEIGLDGLGGHFVENASGESIAAATWVAYNGDSIVAQGEVTTTAGDLDTELVIDQDILNGQLFDRIEFSTDSDQGSNWELKYVDVEFGYGDSFEYAPIDSEGLEGNVSTVNFTIDAPDALSNEAPETSSLTYTMEEDGTLTITEADILSHVTDADSTTGELSVTDLSVTGGILTEVSNGVWSFQPDGDFNGDLDLSYTVSDGQDAASGRGIVTVTPKNDAPTVDGNVSLDDINEDGTVTITQAQLLQGADDVDGDDLSVTGVTLAAGTGSLADNGDGTWTFTPEGDWNGEVELSYSVTDGTVSTPQTANFEVLAVNDAPTVDGNVSLDDINEDGTVTITQAQLLQGAGDVDGDDLSVTGVTLAAGTGSLADNGDGTWTFTPEGDWNGEVELSYSVTDGTVSTPQTANFEVLAVNDAPTAEAETIAATEGADEFSGQVTASDVDADSLTYTLVGEAPDGFTFDTEDGSWTFDPTDAAYNDMADGATRTFNLEYTVSDGTADPITQPLTITVTGTNDGPVANADVLGTVTVTPGDIISATSPTSGMNVAAVAEQWATESGITVRGLTGDGLDSDTWQDASLSTKNVSFSQGGQPYAYSGFGVSSTGNIDGGEADTIDGDDATSEIVGLSFATPMESVTITLSALFDGVDDPNEEGYDRGPYDGGYIETARVAAFDAAGDLIGYVDVDGTPNGLATVTLDAASLGSSLPIAEVAVMPLDDGANRSGNNSDFLVQSVTGETADTISATYLEDTPIDIDPALLTGNDSDVDVGDVLSVTGVGDATHGTVTLGADGHIQFTPKADFSGQATFTYTISDGNEGTSEATVTLNIAPVNDAPVIDLNAQGPGYEIHAADSDSWGYNVLGMYVLDENGDPVATDILYGYSDVSGPDGDTEVSHDVGELLAQLEPGQTPHFFILNSDDARSGTPISEDSEITFTRGEDGTWQGTATDIHGDTVTLDAYFDATDNAYLNPDGHTRFVAGLTLPNGRQVNLAHALHGDELDANEIMYSVEEYSGHSVDWDDVRFTVTPTEDADADFGATFTLNGDPVSIAGDIAIDDVDSAMMSKAVITLTNTQAGDHLNTEGISGGLFVDTDIDADGNLVVTLSGDAPASDYESAIQAITFSTEGDVEASREITVQVTDAGGNEALGSNVATTTIAVEAPDMYDGDVTGQEVIFSSQSASYHNMLGIYTVVDGIPSEPEIILTDSRAANSNSVLKAFAEDEAIRFFLIPNGGSKNLDLSKPLYFVMDDGQWALALGEGDTSRIVDVRFDDPQFNPDGEEATFNLRGLEPGITLDNGSHLIKIDDQISDNDDDDFNDLKIRVKATEDGLFEGMGGDDVAYGQNGKDTLNGGGGDDHLYGGEHNDVLSGGTGDDYLEGNNGKDVLDGGDGADQLYGGEHDDVLNGGAGDDYLEGAHGKDTLDGGDGDDQLYGGEHNDLLIGGAGDDQLYGGNNQDTLGGGDDNDQLHGGSHDDLLLGGDGNDHLYGDGNKDTLGGGDGDDYLDGGSGKDLLVGGGGDDILIGGDGHDMILASTGHDQVSLGEGNDTIFIDQSVLADGGGEMVVSDFDIKHDVLELGDGLSVYDIDMTQADTQLVLSDNDNNQFTITLQGVTPQTFQDHAPVDVSTDTTDSLIQMLVDADNNTDF